MSETEWSVTAPTGLPESWLVSATGTAALLLTATAVVPRITHVRRVMFLLTVLSTIFHEAGHALACCATGGGVRVIEIYTPDSGRTSVWHYSAFSSIVTTAAGYAVPPLAGLGAASLLSRGHAPMVLTITVVVMALVLVVTRDLITLVSVVAVGLVAFAVLRWGTVGLQHGVAYTEAWMLLFGEGAGLWALLSNRFRGAGDPGSDDASSLAGKTGIPAVLWIAAWVALLVWSLWKAVPLLWP
ncbi:M50 family metallopeptidase [Lentzea sp. NPDC059081]|uniref:M50 family metallopeptidase n=1 Tax=Lentzea sp. NPDC059081 TaxID=3346719 RepID=UPI0036C37247